MVDQQDVEALIDNELDPDQVDTVIASIEDNKELATVYQKLIEQKLLLQDWWKNYKKQ